jgi:RNA polymerase sigma-70 factor (ECF subfamily)
MSTRAKVYKQVPSELQGRSTERDHSLSADRLGVERIAEAAIPVPKTHFAPNEQSDEILLERIVAGDKDALAVLFRRYARSVRAVACRILRDFAEADDLVQEVFLHINRKCVQFDPAKGSAKAWITQIAYRRSIDHRRHLCSRSFYTQLSIDDPSLEVADLQANGVPYEESIEAVFGSAGIEKLKRALSKDQLDTIELHFFGGLTIEEIAVRLSQQPGNVRNHYYRALEKLRKHMVVKELRDSGSI